MAVRGQEPLGSAGFPAPPHFHPSYRLAGRQESPLYEPQPLREPNPPQGQSVLPACYEWLPMAPEPEPLKYYQRGGPFSLPPLLDASEAERFLQLIVASDAVTELRVLGATMPRTWPSWPRSGTFSGFFQGDQIGSLINALQQVESAEIGTYIVPNNVRRELLHRRYNRAAIVADAECAHDAKPQQNVGSSIAERRYLLIDFDSPRPPDLKRCSATDVEKGACWSLACDVAAYLADLAAR